MYARLMDHTDHDDLKIGIIHTEIREGEDGKGRKICEGPSFTVRMAENDLFVRTLLLAIKDEMPYPTIFMGLEMSSYFRSDMERIVEYLANRGYTLVDSIGRRRKRFGLF